MGRRSAIPRKILRFPLSAADQGNLDAATITITDTPFDAVPAAFDLAPESSRLAATVNGGSPTPQIRPLFPGTMVFLADGVAGTNPTDIAQVDAANYSGWNVTGTIMIRAVPKDFKDIQALTSATLVDHPNRVWYARVNLPQTFLFQTIRHDLTKVKVKSGASSIGVGHSDWYKHAIMSFLAGTHGVKINNAAAEADDDAIQYQMPEVILDGGNAFVLEVATAYARKPQDAKDADFDTLAAAVGVTRREPAHPRNGRIPARLALRDLKDDTVDADAGNPLADAWLADWPTGPRYTPVRATRTWNKTESNCSVHFPDQTLAVTNMDSDTLLFSGPLPAHGVVYYREEPPGAGDPEPVIPTLAVVATGTMLWANGTDADVWNQDGRAMDAADPFDFIGFAPGTGVEAHLVGRLPMRTEMLLEDFYDPGGLRCTYLSLRRTLRALINNRMAGGRLNFGITATSATTRAIIDAAVANIAWRVAGNLPATGATPDDGNTALYNIMKRIWADDAPTHTVMGVAPPGGLVDPPTIGEVGYRLWQSIVPEFEGATSRFYYPDEYVARGGPGAAAYLGLAGLHHDPSWAVSSAAGVTRNDFLDGVVDGMVDGTLVPGAPLQFWENESRHSSMMTRADDGTGIGHSPVFHSLTLGALGAVESITVIDQTGLNVCAYDNAPTPHTLAWSAWQPEIWISGLWHEDT